MAGYTKKTTVAALFLIAYCAGNIIGPQTFNAKEAPRFRSAEITILGEFSALRKSEIDVRNGRC